LGAPLARGSTAETYRWRPGEIVKLFYEDRTAQEVYYEAQMAKAVQETGLAPRVGEVIHIDHRLGIVYEKVEGHSLTEVIRSDLAESWHVAKQFAELHARIHAVRHVAGLPSQQERLKKKILAAPLLTTALRQKALTRLEHLPMAQHLCHGDFHPNNIIVQDNQWLVIDWTDASLGHPLADVTRTTIILEGVALADPSLAPYLHDFKTAYLECYFALRPGSPSDLGLWRPIIAAARLTEGKEQSWLVQQVRAGLTI
jgi:uncharacterized protein (TIGR02172 family)